MSPTYRASKDRNIQIFVWETISHSSKRNLNKKWADLLVFVGWRDVARVSLRQISVHFVNYSRNSMRITRKPRAACESQKPEARSAGTRVRLLGGVSELYASRSEAKWGDEKRAGNVQRINVVCRSAGEGGARYRVRCVANKTFKKSEKVGVRGAEEVLALTYVLSILIFLIRGELVIPNSHKYTYIVTQNTLVAQKHEDLFSQCVNGKKAKW